MQSKGKRLRHSRDYQQPQLLPTFRRLHLRLLFHLLRRNIGLLLSGDIDWADPIPLQDVARKRGGLT